MPFSESCDFIHLFIYSDYIGLSGAFLHVAVSHVSTPSAAVGIVLRATVDVCYTGVS